VPFNIEQTKEVFALEMALEEVALAQVSLIGNDSLILRTSLVPLDVYIRESIQFLI